MKNLLTNRTLAAFEKWYFETHCKSSIKFEDLLLWQKAEVFDWLYSQCATIQYAFAVEFFDSVGIYFNQGVSFLKSKKFKCEVYQDSIGESYDFHGKFLGNNQAEANTQALEKANEIFNDR